jgi:hypothetical protein
MYKNKRKGEGRGMRDGEGGASLFPEETHWNKKKYFIQREKDRKAKFTFFMW